MISWAYGLLRCVFLNDGFSGIDLDLNDYNALGTPSQVPHLTCLQVLHLPLAQARFVHYYQQENPGSEVSLQADDEVQAMKDMIKQAGTKALQKFLSRLVAEVEGQNRNDS